MKDTHFNYFENMTCSKFWSTHINLFEAIQSTTSKYEGVSWNEKRKLWQAEFYINGKKGKSYFENEFDAAKKLNKLCDENCVPHKNPETDGVLNEKVIWIFLFIF